MSLNLSNFQQAEYVTPEPAPATPIEPARSALAAAIGLGIVGALVGAVGYAAFITISGIQIGYLAIGVAWLVARAMSAGSRGQGGRPFQVAAVVLTLCAVGMGNAMMLWWSLRKEQSVPLSVHNVLVLLWYGFKWIFSEVTVSPVGGLIGLFILFIGLRAAWRMTSGVPGAVAHPFQR